MHVILSFETGRKIEGILLAAGTDRLRVVVRRLNDTMELRLTGGRWVSDRGNTVEIESLLADEGTGAAGFYSRFVPLTHTACN